MTITDTPQKAKLYALFDDAPVVFACRINQSFTTHDKVTEFKYDGVTLGAYTDVKAGMTILLGSTPGAHDKGISYARKTPIANKLYCGETSEVAFADNLYVTVLQDFGIWANYPLVLANGTAYMQHDVAYSNQHTAMKPVPILGPDRIEIFDGLTFKAVSFDGSGSYVPGSTITGNSFTCSGGTVTDGSTATPTVTFTALGRYLLSYTVTSALGASNTTYRTVHIVTRAMLSEVTAGGISGSFGAGFSFTLTALNTTITARERSKVLLVSEEWYADTQESFGPCTGAEHIVAIGWLTDEAVTVDEERGAVSFSARGADYWLQETSNFKPLGFRSVTGTPASWLQLKDMTVDQVLWHLLVWRSTVCNCIDVILTGDTRKATELSAPEGSLWEQIKTFAHKILATANSDRYSRLLIETEAVYSPEADRAGIPVTATLTHDDWESVDIEYATVSKTSQVILSGVAVKNNRGLARVSLAPGHIPEHYGSQMSVAALVLSTQALANELAGNVLSKENAPYKFNIKNLAHNNRLIGIAPRQFVELVILPDDNLRGIAYSGNVVVKAIEYALHDGAWDINLSADMETFPGLAITGDIIKPPATGGGLEQQPPVSVPPIPPVAPPIPPSPPIPPPIPPVSTACTDGSPATGPFTVIWDRTWIDGGADASTRITRLWLPCAIRSATATNQSYLIFEINNLGQAYAHLHCYGIDGAGTRLVTGTITATATEIRVDFSPVAALTVAGFELECDEGLDLTSAGFTVTEVPYWYQFSFYGGTYEISSTIVHNDQPGGAYGVSLHLVGVTHWAGSTWRCQLRIAPAIGSVGILYASVNYSLSSTDPTRRPYRKFTRFGPPEPQDILGDSYSNVSTLIEFQSIETPSDGIPIPIMFDVETPTDFAMLSPYGITVNITLYFWYSSTIPLRGIGMGPVELYNICPAEAA